ncbi:PAS domain S-box protein [Haloarchaeobius sp. TZWWS8]|uniref:PAS domain-containing response regulator n=1 Tax=Haloarchaeobius sp. TZWWS8 TaxID=3446121 RepID=UPI003EBB2AC2
MTSTIRVLHVDDDQALLDLTETMLAREDGRMDVHAETSASDALEVLDEGERFDCVVSDYDMPGMDGLTFLAAIKERYPELPFILFTGKGSEEIASRAISAGVTEYLQKGGGTDRYVVLANRIENAVAKRRAERRREADRNRYQALIEHSSDLVSVLDDEGIVQYVSPSAPTVVGYEPDELTGTSSFDRIHPEDKDEVVESFRSAIDDPTVTPTVEYRYHHGDGDWHLLESKGRNRLEDPDIEGFVVNTRDVTDQRETERELDAERDLFSAAIDALPHTFYISNLDGSPWRWNKDFEELTGYTGEEIASLPTEAFFAEEDMDRIEEVLERVLDGETVVYEARAKTKSGNLITRRISASLLTDEEGEPIAICGVGVDPDVELDL